MSEDNEPPKTDTTSFASILAGVQKLRGDSNTPTTTATTATAQTQAQPTTTSTTTTPSSIPASTSALPRPSQNPLHRSSQQNIPQKRTNAFNQDRTTFNASKAGGFQKSGSPKPSSISVNKTQTGNPLLQNIVNVNWTYVESRNPYDYLVKNRQVIFLSLKYHKLHPEYIQNKMKPLLRKNAILLTVVDIENSESILREINKICLFNEFTLLLAFNFEQAAKYLTYLATSV